MGRRVKGLGAVMGLPVGGSGQFVDLGVDGMVEERAVGLAFGVEAHVVFVEEAEFFLHLHVVDEAGGFVVFEQHFGDAFVVAFLYGEGDDVVAVVGGELEVGVEVVVDAVYVAVHGPCHGVAEQFHEWDDFVVEVEFVAVDAVVEVGGVDDVVFAFGGGVEHGDVGFDVAFFGGFYFGDVEGAVAVVGGAFFYEVVPEGVLQGAVLLVGGEQFVEYDAVLRGDGLRAEGGCVEQCYEQCDEGGEVCSFHVVGCFKSKSPDVVSIGGLFIVWYRLWLVYCTVNFTALPLSRYT